MNHHCPTFCHPCPDLDDDVMPSCLGTSALGGADPRSLTWCTCSANGELLAEEAAAARIAALEARIAALEAAR